jgi:predicted flap endonuclease-1-like 5' DNA nuclease
MTAKGAFKDDLESIPGIGPSLARDLRALRIRQVADLKRRDPNACTAD